MKKVFALILCFVLTLTLAAQQWQPVGDIIKTKWASDIDPSNPLSEYPRPQMVRGDWQSLNGLWRYAITDIDATSFTHEGDILVPYPVESSLSGVQKRVSTEQALWYERTFTTPKSWKGKRILLHFGAVDWSAEVSVNGVAVGSHTGGYSPFYFDVTDYVKVGAKNEICVKVKDATDNSFQPRGKQVTNNSGIWYTPVTGIWQTVWIEAVNQTHIESFYAVSDIDASTFTFDVAVKALANSDKVNVEILDGAVGYNPQVPSTNVLSSAELVNGKAVIKVDNMRYWSAIDPYLYGVRITVTRDGKVVDQVNGYTAAREISSIKDENGYKRIAVNNEPVFMFGPLDQGWWPDGLYTAPTDEALKYDVQKTKDFGYNMIRKHIKVEPARWFYWCDVIGIYVWQDMPSIADYCDLGRDKELAEQQNNIWARDSFIGGTDTDVPAEWKDNFYKEWREIMNFAKVFPSVVMWVPFNEAWGQFDTKSVVDFTRAIDPTRLINEASGGNLQMVGDVIDVHNYPQPAIHAFEAKFINVLGEYGGIAYPIDGHLWSESSRNFGYGNNKKSGDEVLQQYDIFAKMLEKYIFTGCAAAVYTQTTDVETEVNGLMTYDRAIIKMNEAELRKINQSVINSLPKGTK